ncbi:MAG TPA: hypothetical protein VKB57_00245, partial [Acidimicrobiales bacterium]|nr:hypothetical protein [Acidimicrobiales bacterium]
GFHAHTEPEDVAVGTLKVAAVVVLAFLPGWLYVRFLGQRAGALWNEYVLNLHRLAWDEPAFLPEPPCASPYREDWEAAQASLCPRKAGEMAKVNIYQQKFDAYYGRSVSAVKPETDFTVRVDMLFPVFLATAWLAIGWTAVLWDASFASAPATVWDVMKYAFVGAYIFALQSLIRRFFQSDLRPSAYASLLVRFIVALSMTVALVQILDVSPASEAAVAFVVGIFPAVALQALKRNAQALLGVRVRSATADYPLDQIDGLDLWYQDRLMEEGIEDMQNLATASLVDVMLHCRVPVNRLIDWVDQAHLYLHLDHAETDRSERRAVDRQLYEEVHKAEHVPSPTTLTATDQNADLAHARIWGSTTLRSRAGTRTRLALRQLGIRTATDLLNVFPDDESMKEAKETHSGLDEFQIRLLRRALMADEGLIPVRNWQARGVKDVTKVADADDESPAGTSQPTAA